MDAVDASEQMHCHYPGCKSKCKTFQGLVKHPKGAHGMEMPQLKHHWVHTMAIGERNPKVLTRLERRHIALVFNGDGSVNVQDLLEGILSNFGTPCP